MTDPLGPVKILLVRALPDILPRMTIKESLDVTRIDSIADELPTDVLLVNIRSFRLFL